MIKNFKLILLLILFIPVTQAQQTSRFPIKPGSVWRINYEYSCTDIDFSHEGGDEEYKYFIDGDTLIGSSTYFKLFKTGIIFLETPFLVEHKYIGAIRDSVDRFYFIEENESAELLLYDFSVGLGDSVYYDGFSTKIPVDVLDTLPDGRKRFLFYIISVHCGSYNTIIEGIGWLGGLLEGNACSSHPGVRGSYLVCYSEGNEIVYESTHTRCGIPVICNNEFTSVKDISSIRKPEIIVLPGKLLKINLNESIHATYEIEVFDMMGKKMLYQKSDLTESLNISQFDDGAYFLRLSDEKTQYSLIFVVR